MEKPIETLSLEQLATVQGGRYGVNRPRPTSNTPKRRR
jgi:hypothetical protein